jgi:hypothetical protein
VTDTLTVIRSRYLRLAKTIHADGRTGAYGQAKTIDLFEMPVSGLDAIGDLLTQLLPQPSCAVVFGSIADPARARRVRRLAYPDPDTGDLPTLRAIPHRWCALDMGGIARPESIPAGIWPVVRPRPYSGFLTRSTGSVASPRPLRATALNQDAGCGSGSGSTARRQATNWACG